ncbi:7468_t:CDS:10 [Funneliformis mosseae]|uniref:7468_t:CDS:1 n=3 Tax=Funneliformis TaxID=1117308 RepID=A0A9N9C9P4_FUNMO|nr:7468_t:CDS:10 [Funneliformis mosseae]
MSFQSHEAAEYLENLLASTGNREVEGYLTTPQLSNVPSVSFPNVHYNNMASVFAANNALRGSTSIISNHDNSQQSSNQITHIQPSAYDINNIPSSLDPLFNLSSVIGSGMGNIASDSGSGVSASSSTGLQSMMPQVLSQIPPPPVTATTVAGVTTNFPGLYSSTGFDMLGVLARVASRPNPQINIGPVDMSCSFLVVDARKYDFPIVYASHTFEKLTGYSNSEIIGRNCRFLQAPDGHVALGSRRRYTDNNAVYHIKSHMVAGKECQASIINYRKGGQPFINLVTVIPITWDSEEIVYFVGFQVDLVEQPNAILEKMKDGTYVVNYSLMNLPQYIPPSGALMGESNVEDYFRDSAMPFPASPEVFELIGGNADTEGSKRMWNKMLLEHSDDFIHVLSLKGIFLYCSPSCRRILEYDTNDLLGSSLSTICHPSDIVPVMRELKESSNGAESVNLVYRIRRKNSGYMWFEAHGKLHLEQGKGRKCVILSARERSVYKLQWKDLQTFGGISDQEFWAKLSVDGLFLYASSTCQCLLNFTSEELVGTSLYHYVRSDRTTDITRSLTAARDGNAHSFKHHIQKKNGQYVEVLTTFYPGDSINTNNKPSFVICQTKEVAPEIRRRSISVSPAQSSPTSAGSPDGASSISSGGSTPSPSIHLRNASIEHQPTDNIFEELDTTRSTSWQYELHQMRLTNKRLREELETIKHSKKKRKKRSASSSNKVCHHCQRKDSPEWRKGPDGPKTLCNACGLRYAKQMNAQFNGPRSPSASPKIKPSVV